MNEGTVKRRKGGRTLSPRAQSVWSIVQLLIGSMIVAISFNMFMVPNGIASGGVSGYRFWCKEWQELLRRSRNGRLIFRCLL